MTKKRDKEYGPKPQDVPLKREELPPSSAKLPRGYCKKRKAEHLYELDHVSTYKHHSYPQGWRGPWYLTGWTDYKWYQCQACGKKKLETERYKLDEPVPTRNEAYP